MTAGHRLTSRVLLYDRDGRILLFLTKAPDTSGTARWITPGGGVDPGETHADAAVRELFEETGLVVASAGEPVWSHDFTVEWDAADHSTGHAEFYALEVDRFEPSNANWTQDEHVDVLAHRWLSAGELRQLDEPFEPASLPGLLEAHRPNRELIMSSNSSEISLGELVTELEAQQQRLRCDRFTHDDAWELGNLLVAMARSRTLAVAVDITIGDSQVFHAALPGTSAENDYWIARKVRTVKRFGDSSFLVGRRHAAAGTDFHEETGLDFGEYVSHGGCFPLVLTTGELVGTVTVSGLPQEADHALAVEALEKFLGLQP